VYGELIKQQKKLRLHTHQLPDNRSDGKCACCASD